MNKVLKLAATAALVAMATVGATVPAQAASPTLAPRVLDSCC
jgi:hypothetical protein